MFDEVLLKITSILCALLLCIVPVSLSLYLGTRDKLTSLQTQYRELQQVSVEAEESKKKVVEGSKQDDTLTVEKDTKVASLEDEKSSFQETSVYLTTN
jgi:hypothetical protein